MTIDSISASCDFHRGYDSQKQQKKKKRNNYSKKRYDAAFELTEKKDHSKKDDIILKKTYLHDLPRKSVSKEEQRKGKKIAKKQQKKKDVKSKRKNSVKKDNLIDSECICIDDSAFIFPKPCDHESCAYIDENFIIGSEPTKCMDCCGILPPRKMCYRETSNKSFIEKNFCVNYSDNEFDGDFGILLPRRYECEKEKSTIVFNGCYCQQCEENRMNDDLRRAELLRITCNECYNDFRKCECESSATRRFNFWYHGYY